MKRPPRKTFNFVTESVLFVLPDMVNLSDRT